MSYTSKRQFQAYQGPTDPMLKSTELEGYQPVSRIGEVVVNAFIDHYEYARLGDEGLKTSEMTGAAPVAGEKMVEHKPAFHEWATVLPGMICVSRKARGQTFRNYVAAETASPVVACAAGLKKDEEKQWFFAGIARSKSITPIDDGIGPSTDEFFTVAIGGMATLLNNSAEVIYPGDTLEWTFFSEHTDSGKLKRSKTGPRRLGIKVADALSERVIGRALTFSKPGEMFDLLIRGC